MEKIVSIDTNVLVRFLVKDDPQQCAAAKDLFTRQACFIPESVLLESEWVMRAVYGAEPSSIANGYRALLRMGNVLFPDAELLRQGLDWFEDGFDFADALHLARSEGYPMKTFDANFVKRASAHGYQASSPSNSV
jgi:predicted nucleic-acid-binding protein